MSDYFAHETAVIDAGAKIGPRTKIWHFCHIESGAKIGADCVLGQNVYVAGSVIIGDGVKIQNNVSLYDGVTIDAYAFLGPSCVFTNVINPRSEIVRKNELLPTRVGRGATIGANATIVCGHDIGAYALLGAGTVVTANIPPFALVLGVPARQVGWICRCGVRLTIERGAGWCAACGRGYRADADGIAEA